MNSKEFLASKGIYGLDTKKRMEEVLQWMDEYASAEVSPKLGELVKWMEEENEKTKNEYFKNIYELCIQKTKDMQQQSLTQKTENNEQ